MHCPLLARNRCTGCAAAHNCFLRRRVDRWRASSASRWFRAAPAPVRTGSWSLKVCTSIWGSAAWIWWIADEAAADCASRLAHIALASRKRAGLVDMIQVRARLGSSADCVHSDEPACHRVPVSTASHGLGVADASALSVHGDAALQCHLPPTRSLTVTATGPGTPALGTGKGRLSRPAGASPGIKKGPAAHGGSAVAAPTGCQLA